MIRTLTTGTSVTNHNKGIYKGQERANIHKHALKESALNRNLNSGLLWFTHAPWKGATSGGASGANGGAGGLGSGWATGASLSGAKRVRSRIRAEPVHPACSLRHKRRQYKDLLLVHVKLVISAVWSGSRWRLIQCTYRLKYGWWWVGMRVSGRGNRKSTYDLKLNKRWRLMYSNTRSSRRYLTDWPRPRSRRINEELTSLGTQFVISVMLFWNIEAN